MKTMLGIILLSILAPLTAEILNGSTRLSELGSWNVFGGTILPYSFLIIVLAYFAQSAVARASALFLLPIAGIVVEGLIVKSFFNISFSDLSVLGGVGVLGGVQWPWTLSLIASHAFVTFLIPITIAMFLIKEIKVGKVAAYFSMAVLTLFIGWTTVITPHSFSGYWIKLFALVLIIAASVYFSRTVRVNNSSGVSAPTYVFFIGGCLFPVLNWLTSFFIATKAPVVIITAQLIFICAYFYFLWTQWFNENTTQYKHLAFVAGYYIPFALGLTLAGVNRGVMDYKIVGACLFIAILALMRTTIRQSAQLQEKK